MTDLTIELDKARLTAIAASLESSGDDFASDRLEELWRSLEKILRLSPISSLEGAIAKLEFLCEESQNFDDEDFTSGLETVLEYLRSTAKS